jgi:hypothetical protein
LRFAAYILMASKRVLKGSYQLARHIDFTRLLGFFMPG